MTEQIPFVAYGHRLLDQPWLAGLHAVSDVLIASAFFVISAAVWVLVSKRPDLEMRGLARILVAFFLLSGAIHLIDALPVWWPIHEVEGALKGGAAAVSMVIAGLVFRPIWKALAFPAHQLRHTDRRLEDAIAAHRRTLSELDAARAELEKRGDERAQELSEATTRFRLLFAHAPVAMVMVGSDGHLQQANEAAERVFGYAAEDLVGRKVEELLPASLRAEHASLREAYLETPSARPMGRGRELYARRKSGEEFPVEIGLNPLKLGGDQTAVVASIIDISARRQAEQRLQFIMRELSHRSKNLLALLQGIVRQTARSAKSVDSFEREFSRRLQGLARSHELLVARDWQGAPLEDLVRSQLDFLTTRESAVTIQGPPVMLTPAATQNIGLALHELATNAVKHGALAHGDGRISVSWDVEGELAQPELSLHWSEKGGRIVAGAVPKGFGRVVLEEVIPRALEGTARLTFGADGVHWELRTALQHISDQQLQDA